MSYRTTAPRGHTCPDIDRAMKDIQSIINTIEQVRDKLEDIGLQDDLFNIISELKDLGVGNRCSLEELRDSNSSLRDWGENLATAVIDLENEKANLESIVVEKDDIISELQKNITDQDYTIVDKDNQIEELEEKISKYETAIVLMKVNDVLAW